MICWVSIPLKKPSITICSPILTLQNIHHRTYCYFIHISSIIHLPVQGKVHLLVPCRAYKLVRACFGLYTDPDFSMQDLCFGQMLGT